MMFLHTMTPLTSEGVAFSCIETPRGSRSKQQGQVAGSPLFIFKGKEVKATAKQLNRLYLLEAQKGLIKSRLEHLDARMALSEAVVDLEMHLGGASSMRGHIDSTGTILMTWSPAAAPRGSRGAAL